jgi:hypothetical protein
MVVGCIVDPLANRNFDIENSLAGSFGTTRLRAILMVEA